LINHRQCSPVPCGHSALPSANGGGEIDDDAAARPHFPYAALTFAGNAANAVSRSFVNWRSPFAGRSNNPARHDFSHKFGLACIIKRLARGVERFAHYFCGGIIKYAARKEWKNDPMVKPPAR
jgi:hypothetical protein